MYRILKQSNIAYILVAMIIIITLYLISIALGITTTIVMNRSVYELNYSLLIYSPYNYVVIVISVLAIAIVGILRRNKVIPLLLMIYAVLYYIVMNDIHLVIYLTIALNIASIIILFTKESKSFIKNSIHYLILTLIAIEIVTIAYVLFSSGNYYWELTPLIFERSIYAIPIAILPYIALALLFKWIIDLIMKRRKRKYLIHINSIAKNSFIEENGLIIAIAIALILIMSPYLLNIGRPIKPISEDTEAYVHYLSKIEEKGFPPLITTNPNIIRHWRYVLQRPLHFIILYAIYEGTKINPIVLLDYIHHIICIPIILFLIWLITKNLFNRTIAGLAVLLTSCSPLVISFRVGGFQANEMNLVLLLTYFLILITMKRSWYIISAIALGIVSWLIHPWTSAFFIISSIPFIFILYRKDKNKRKLLNRVITVVPLILFPIAVLIVMQHKSLDILEILGEIVFRTEYGALIRWSKENIINILINVLTKIPSEMSIAIRFYCWSALSMPFIYIPCLLTIYDPLTLSLSPIALASTTLFGRATYIFRILMLVPYSITAAIAYSRTNKYIQLLAILANLNMSLQIVLNVVEV